MKIELITVLRKCDDVDIVELNQAMRMVSWLKTIETENGIGPLELAKKLDVSIELYRNMRTGTYPFDLRTIAKIEAVDQELERKRSRKSKS